MTCTATALAATITAFSITDGDTIRAGDERMRICGIDAPETYFRPEPGGKEATAYLKRLTAGQPIDVYVTPQGQDRYGRWVVVLILPDGRDVACEMVRAGHAEDVPRYSGGKYEDCKP